jgi:hypothetical protein
MAAAYSMDLRTRVLRDSEAGALENTQGPCTRLTIAALNA